ncbi:MAG: LPXTG cell wall anchor domain-containing protein [Acidimicrobiia bacterium]
MKTKQVGLGILIMSAAVAAGGMTQMSAASAAQSCARETYSWTDGTWLWMHATETYDTGLVIPGPGAGETLTIVESTYTSFDEYPADGSGGNRVDAGQLHESFGISIGGTPFGGLTTDAPNGPDDGAPDQYYSGLVSGSFGTGTTTGGAIVLRHASLYGFTESPNSIYAQSIKIVVERCTEIPEPETTPPTTTPPPPPAVVLPDEVTTTTAESSPPEASVLGVMVRAADQELPATGNTSGTLVLAASVFALSGLGLLIVRRRPSAS